MARALIVGCGCRGSALASELKRRGWLVRGTARDPAGLARIEAAGVEAAQADPDRAGSILDHVGDVTVVFWLLGSAAGEPELVEAANGPRLERVLEKLVDSPVRGFVYEGAGSVPAERLAAGASLVRAAGGRWRIPVRVVKAEPQSHGRWLAAMVAAAEGLLAPPAA